MLNGWGPPPRGLLTGVERMSRLPYRGGEVGTGGEHGDERGLGKGVADAFVVPLLAGGHRRGAPNAPELVAWSE